MQCRKTALALALASLASAAHARLPADVQIERLSPTRIAVVWSGALVPAEKLDVGLAPAPGKPVDGATLRDDVAGSAGRVELEHASGVRPYVWIGDNKGNEATLGERVLPLQGGVNFRDLGGYRTDDGRSVRWGRLYRSGVMADLTDSDYAYLQRLGITAICDLRDSRERSHSPTQAGRIARGGRYIAWDYQQDFDMKAFAGAFAMGGDPQETALRLMAAFYRQMPAAFAARYREAFDVLKQGDGLLFNCSAGKDRTGLLAALVLTALGVAPDVVVNDYESNLLQERTGWDEKQIVSRVKAYITTRGPKGAVIHTPEKTYDIPPAHERRVVDPTGCGDAFRAGLIYGIEKGYDWLTIGRMGNLMGALKVEHPGTQNQRFTFDEFNEQFKQQFGYALNA